eukprot:588269-Heterocapsa_arctica.AAC.1
MCTKRTDRHPSLPLFLGIIAAWPTDHCIGTVSSCRIRLQNIQNILTKATDPLCCPVPRAIFQRSRGHAQIGTVFSAGLAISLSQMPAKSDAT